MWIETWKMKIIYANELDNGKIENGNYLCKNELDNSDFFSFSFFLQKLESSRYADSVFKIKHLTVMNAHYVSSYQNPPLG